MSPVIPPPAATFLGSAVLGSNATTIGPVVFGPGWGYLYVYHFIAGYTGGDIALLRLGTGATVDTGTTYSSYATLLGASTVTSTALASTSGIKVAQDTTTNARRGHHEIFNGTGTGFNKFVDSRTLTYSAQNPTSATTVTSQSIVTGTWFNTAQAQCAGLFGGLGGASLLAGSFISVYGIPGTG